MTTTGEQLLPAAPPPKPTLYDRWSARVAEDPRLERLWRWLAPTLLTALAFVLRVVNLGHPHDLVFDETYYVKDAWSEWNLGYTATWPESADERFVDGETDIYTTLGSFSVHPPLGRLLIALGMAAFGAGNGWGWRMAVCLAGTGLVLVLYLIARRLTGSIAFASVAALLLAVDGMAIAMSRVALLDGLLALFVLLAFWFVLLDRSRHLERLDAGIAARRVGDEPPAWGPVLWNRPWVIAAGAAVGAATAVKWSGLYVAAGLGIYLVVTDALARRRAGVAFWPTDALRQGVAAFVLFIPVALGVYLASWIGWLTSDGGYDRHAMDASPAEGLWVWVPLPLQNLWKFHQDVYGFHVGLSSPHGYMSPAWQWPLLVRPTSMHFARDAYGQNGCLAPEGCVENVYSMPNPLVWYAAVAAVLWLCWRFAIARDWRIAFALTGVALTYVPWLLYPERTIFQFYTVVILPFLMLSLAFALRDIAGPPGADAYRRATGQRLVIVFLGVALLVAAFWYPVVTGMPVPEWFYRMHNWMPGWV